MYAAIVLVVYALTLVSAILGGYRFGKRIPVLGVPLAVASGWGAYYLFYVWEFTYGEGASGGVVVIWAIAKGIAILCAIFSVFVLVGLFMRKKGAK